MIEPILDWEQRYRDATTAWERGELNPAFQALRPTFSENPGTVIIPGCGRAPEVLAFAQLGWHVIGIDVAETAVMYQRECLASAGLTGDIQQENLFDWHPSTPVELIYEQTCLCALDPQQWPAYERVLREWLRSGGTLAALFMQKEGEGGPPFHCDIESMQGLFASTHWDWGEQAFRAVHPVGVCELTYLLTRR